MENFKLSFGEVTIKKTTPAVRKALREIETLYKNLEAAESVDVAKKLTELNGGKELDLRAIQRGDASITTEDAAKIQAQGELFHSLNETTGALKDERVLATCRAVIDTRPLTRDQAALVASDVKGDFWQEQDLSEVARIIKSFRDQFSG
jgi:hypothetical protein